VPNTSSNYSPQTGADPSMMQAVRNRPRGLRIPAYDVFSPELMDITEWHKVQLPTRSLRVGGDLISVTVCMVFDFLRPGLLATTGWEAPVCAAFVSPVIEGGTRPEAMAADAALVPGLCLAQL
jgi:hypothetical protein